MIERTMKPTPPIFISATSADLAKAREIVRDALLEIGCFPVVQQHFPTGQGEIAPKEANTIATCKAVIHLSGRMYGAEPLSVAEGSAGEGARPRRSYTQLEYNVAVASGKPVYVFLATDIFYEEAQNRPDPAAPLPVEDADKQRLQQEHCSALRHGNNLWYEFSTLAELRQLVLKLPERDEVWAAMFKAERRTNLIAAVVVVVLLTSGTLVILRHSKGVQKTVKDVRADTQSMPQIKDTVIEVSGQVSAIDAKLAELQKVLISQSVDPETAIEIVAAKYGLTSERLKSGIETFVTNYDRASQPPPEQSALRNIAGKFVMRGNTPAEFASYLESVQFKSWKPSFIVLHSTETPLQTWMKSPEKALASFFKLFVNDKGWSGGPHLFVDESKIWVFNALNMPGVHARTWNKESVGVEMVGQYDAEPLSPVVRDTTVSALVALCRKLGLPATAIRFHNEQQPGGTNCPGKNVNKADFIQRVAAALGGTAHGSPEKVPAQPPVDGKAYTEIMAKVVHVIVEQLGIKSSQVLPTASLVKDLGADSLDLVEIIMALEDEFELEIPDDDAVNVKTVTDIAKLVARKTVTPIGR